MKHLEDQIKKALSNEHISESDAKVSVTAAGAAILVNIVISSPEIMISHIKRVIEGFERATSRTSDNYTAPDKICIFIRYAPNAFDEAIQPILPTVQKIYNTTAWNGKTIAKSSRSKLIYTKRHIGAQITEQRGHKSSAKVIYSPEQMAALIWRYKKYGTIQA